MGGAMTSAKATLETMRGLIVSDWKTGEGLFNLACTVPVGSTATVILPASNPASIREGNRPLAQASGVKLLRTEAGKTFLSVESGSYQFSCGM